MRGCLTRKKQVLFFKCISRVNAYIVRPQLEGSKYSNPLKPLTSKNILSFNLPIPLKIFVINYI